LLHTLVLALTLTLTLTLMALVLTLMVMVLTLVPGRQLELGLELGLQLVQKLREGCVLRQGGVGKGQLVLGHVAHRAEHRHQGGEC
jgi:hypothetical protein